VRPRALRILLPALLAAWAGAAVAQAGPAAAPATAPATAGFDAQFDAARQWVRDGKREEALAAFTALLARSPDNSDVLLARGRLHAWMKHWPEAEADLTAATRKSPKYGDAWSALGDLYRWTDRPAPAAEAYARWSQLAPADPAPHLARARALRVAGDAEGARQEIDAARALGAAPAEVEKELAALQPGARAPDAVAHGFDWTARLDGGQTWVSGAGSSDYRNYTASLRRHFEPGSLALEVLGVDRFGKRDTAYALDAYADLWARAYANLRYQVAPDHALFPETSGRVELYQGVGSGWELAGSYDWLNFSSSNVGIYGAAVAKYVGAYYGRLRTTYVDTSGSVGWRLTVRDYYRGDADHYVELNAGTSRGEATTRGVTSLQTSTSVGLAWLMFFTPQWGLKLAADYSDSQPAETGISAAIYSRW
jgi:YaiO family outer membrane protein